MKENPFYLDLDTRPNLPNVPLDELHTLKSIESPNPFQLLRVLKDNADLSNKEKKIIQLNEGIKFQEEQLKSADQKIEDIQKNYIEVNLITRSKRERKKEMIY
jgi:wyosine [tRNA(Phe)-imidazoG37] synthetase (radical SAM superfamily)